MPSQSTIRPPSAQKGSAVLIYFNFMESQATYRLVQDQIRLSKLMEGYERVVLLKRTETPKWLDFSEKDEKMADVIAAPTKSNFFKYLVGLAKDGWFIDLRIFSHGWSSGFGGATAVADEDQITHDDLEKYLAPQATGLSSMPIRSVWGTDCWGSRRNALWVKYGAKVSSGSYGVNFYPNTSGNFADAWGKGNVPFDQAVSDADTATARTVVQTFISLVDAPAKKKAGVWDGCKFGRFVLGDSDCAKDYFSKVWHIGSIWQAGKSGKDMMNISSCKQFAGDRRITMNSRPKWA